MVTSDEKHRKTYSSDGVVLLKGVLDATQRDALGQAVERTIDESTNYFHYRMLWPHDEALSKLCRESVLPQLAAQFLNTDKVNLLFDQLFVKEANSNAATGWHNDQPYWPVRGDSLLSVWITLDSVTRDGGAMEFVRGSHRWNRRFAPFHADPTGGFSHYVASTDSDKERLPDIDAAREQYDIVSFDMQPGDALVFHGLTVHGARANRLPRRRRAYAVRYIGEEARYWPETDSVDFLLNDRMAPGDPFDGEMFPLVYSRE